IQEEFERQKQPNDDLKMPDALPYHLPYQHDLHPNLRFDTPTWFYSTYIELDPVDDALLLCRHQYFWQSLQPGRNPSNKLNVDRVKAVLPVLKFASKVATAKV